MPAISDMVLALTEPTGPGNSQAQADPNASLGGFLATTPIDLVAVKNNLFDQVSDAEATAGDTNYRCIVVHNTHATEQATNVRVWIESAVSGGSTEEIGVDPTATSAEDSGSAQTVTVANEATAPAGVVFSAAGDEGSAIILGNIPALSCRAFWWKRAVAPATASKADDGATIRTKWSN